MFGSNSSDKTPGTSPKNRTLVKGDGLQRKPSIQSTSQGSSTGSLVTVSQLSVVSSGSRPERQQVQSMYIDLLTFILLLWLQKVMVLFMPWSHPGL